MNNQFPHIIKTYFQSSNAYDSDELVTCFADNAILYDEGMTFHGPIAIKEHLIKANSRASVNAVPTHLREDNDTIVVTAALSGDFHPFSLEFHFTIEENKITKLNITDI